MESSDVVTQLTLKALDEKCIHLEKRDYNDDEQKIEFKNDFNAKQIADFYNAIKKGIYG